MESNQHLDNLAHIRSLMEKSTRFLSLSGLTGVAAGVYALVAAFIAWWYLDNPTVAATYSRLIHPLQLSGILTHYLFFVALAAATLAMSLVTGIAFTMRKASKRGETVWNKASKRMAINLMIPLAAGGLFCAQLINYGLPELVAPAMLIFYGLALINGSKYTLEDIRYLGLIEIALGILNLFLISYGLWFWAIGFGVMHIVYGVAMYYKYEA